MTTKIDKIKTKAKPKMNKKKGGVGSKSKSSNSLDKNAIISRRTPINITTIGDDARLLILESAFKFTDIIDNKTITDYIRLRSNIPKISKSFKEIIGSMKPTFKKVSIINLHDIEITKDIIVFLSMIDERKIVSVVLRNIRFDSTNTRNIFTDLVSKYSNIRNIILENAGIKIEELLIILMTYKRLQWLEISRYELTDYEYHDFIKIMIYSKEIKYLTFKRNKIDRKYNIYLFTKDEDNVIYIDNERYKIYISKEDNDSWGMIIKRDNGSFIKKIEVNIVGNDVANYMGSYKNFRNDFAEHIKFIGM
jgi:hypothetical protein